MYRLSQRGRPADPTPLARGRCNYPKENVNPNCISFSSQTSFSVKNDLAKMGQRKNSPSRLQPSDYEFSNLKPVTRRREAQHTNKAPNHNEEEDFIRLENIGISSRGVHSQLLNAMKRQLQRQKAQMDALQETVAKLTMRDKTQQSEIRELKRHIEELEEELEVARQEERVIRPDVLNEEQEVSHLRQQNQRLADDLEGMQEMVKRVLLEREKQRVTTLHR